MVTKRAVIIAIDTEKEKLIKKAKRKGLYENFGQQEVRNIQNKFNYHSMTNYDSADSKAIIELIRGFGEWASKFNDKDLEDAIC